MGRPHRVHVEGGIYHVTARGNNRQAIFLEDLDRLFFCRLIVEGLGRFEQRLLSFCLMKNHVHLLLQVEKWPIAALAHNVCFRYARWFNWKRGRTGHLFERRHHSKLIESDLQLLQTLRYIHLNPVEAGISERPDDYRWTSHHAYLDRPCVLPVTTFTGLSLFGPASTEARRSYERFVESADERDPVEFLSTGAVDLETRRQDTEETEDLHDLALPGVDLVLEVCLYHSGTTAEDLASGSQNRLASRVRSLAACLVQEARNLTIVELAKQLDRDPSSLSKGAERLRRKAKTCSKTAWLLTQARQDLHELMASRKER